MSVCNVRKKFTTNLSHFNPLTVSEIPTLLFWPEASYFSTNISCLPLSLNIIPVFKTLPFVV